MDGLIVPHNHPGSAANISDQCLFGWAQISVTALVKLHFRKIIGKFGLRLRVFSVQ